MDFDSIEGLTEDQLNELYNNLIENEDSISCGCRQGYVPWRETVGYCAGYGGCCYYYITSPKYSQRRGPCQCAYVCMQVGWNL